MVHDFFSGTHSSGLQGGTRKKDFAVKSKTSVAANAPVEKQVSVKTRNVVPRSIGEVRIAVLKCSYHSCPGTQL